MVSEAHLPQAGGGKTGAGSGACPQPGAGQSQLVLRRLDRCVAQQVSESKWLLQPRIELNLLQHAEDMATLVRGVKKCREILAAIAFDGYRGEELSPGPAMQSDEMTAEKTADSILHGGVGGWFGGSRPGVSAIGRGPGSGQARASESVQYRKRSAHRASPNIETLGARFASAPPSRALEARA